MKELAVRRVSRALTCLVYLDFPLLERRRTIGGAEKNSSHVCLNAYIKSILLFSFLLVGISE